MCDFLLIHTFGKCVQVPLSLFIYMKKLNNSQQLLFITNMISPVVVLAKIEKKCHDQVTIYVHKIHYLREGGGMNTSSYIPRSILKTLKKCDDIFN